MVNIVNYQLYGYPVMMYGMMALTVGAITYASVGDMKMSSFMSAIPSFPSSTAPPTDSASSPVSPGLPPAVPPSTTPSQGGKKKRKSSNNRKVHGTSRSKKHRKA